MEIKRLAFIPISNYRENTKRNRARIWLRDYISSLEDNLVNCEFDVIIIDNDSDRLLDDFDVIRKYDYLYLKTDKNGGLVRAWNVGANFAFLNGNDFIMVTNDDIIFNKTINELVPVLNQHQVDYKEALYGVLTDSKTAWPHHIQKFGNESIREVTNRTGHFPGLHGWFLGFHRLYFQYFNVDGKLFDERWPWGSSEKFQIDHKERGGRQFIINEVTVTHLHNNSWR